jgi:hypothetical protein
MADKMDPRELWVQWTHDAVKNFEPSDEAETMEDVVEEMIDMSADYASGMLDAFEEVFGPIEGRVAKRAAKTTKPRARRKDNDD